MKSYRKLVAVASFAVCTALLGDEAAPAKPVEKAPVDAEKPAPPPRPDRLPEVVVTATRNERDPFDVPYSVSVMGDDQLQSRRSFRTLTDALGEVPGVMVQKTGYGQASPFLRGFTGFRTLMLIDGIRLNNSVFRAGPNQYWGTVDPLSVRRMELVKGPGSVLYGSDAIGGVLNAVSFTRDPQDGPGWERRVYLRGASAEHSILERVELNGAATERVGLAFGYSHKDFGDLEAGSPTARQQNTAYHEWDLDASLVYRFNPDTALTFAHQEVRQYDAPRTHSTIFAQSFHGTTPGTDLMRDLDQTRDLTYLKLKTEHAGSFFETGEFTLSHHVQYEQQDRIQTAALDVQGFTVETLGASFQLTSPGTSIGTLTYGGEFYHDDIDSFRGNFDTGRDLERWRPRGPVADAASYDLYGCFLQDEITVSPRWDLTLGARYTHAEATAHHVADPFDSLIDVRNALPVKRAWDNVSGNARILWKATPEIHPFAGIAQGFRAPNLSDLTQFDAARSGEVNVPSPNLEPEEYLTKEVGVKHRDPKLSWQAAYYHTEIDHAIERVPTGDLSGTSRVIKRDNVGRGHVQGVELEGSVRTSKAWALFANAQWQEGQVDTYVTSRPEDQDMNPMSRIAPRSVLLGSRWEGGGERGCWFEATGQFVDSQDRISPDDELDNQRIPPGGSLAYTVFSLRGGMDLRPGTALSLGLENLTDQDYRVLGSGTNSPGRNVVLTLDSRF